MIAGRQGSWRIRNGCSLVALVDVPHTCAVVVGRTQMSVIPRWDHKANVLVASRLDAVDVLVALLRASPTAVGITVVERTFTPGPTRIAPPLPIRTVIVACRRPGDAHVDGIQVRGGLERTRETGWTLSR